VIIGTWPEDGSGRIFIRGYEGGKYEELVEAFHRDASLLLDQGYEPAGQHYIEGQWGFVMALVATVTIPLLIGVIRVGLSPGQAPHRHPDRHVRLPRREEVAPEHGSRDDAPGAATLR